MSRPFTISFTHENLRYNAVVSVHVTTLFTEYILGSMDKKIRDLLPSVLVIETDTEMRFRHQTTEHPAPLLNDILKSIQAHIQVASNLSL